MLLWSDLALLPEVSEWSAAWTAFRKAAGLTDGDFVSFVRDLVIEFAPPAPDDLLRPDGDRVEEDIQALAGTLQALVADPAHPVQLSRDAFLDRLGWSDRLLYRHRHRFPVPPTPKPCSSTVTWPKAEPKRLRYRLLHAAGRITRGQRRTYLRLAAGWALGLPRPGRSPAYGLIPLPDS